MPESALTPKSAVVIPDHELIRPIGRGSYGEVWLARSALGVHRAVKIVRRDHLDRDWPVERELEGIQRYEPISRSHENQVHILHVGRFAEGFFYVMELADDAGRPPGSSAPFSTADYVPRTLRSAVHRSGRLPVAECLEIGLKLTDALAHLHAHGLVHRDIKPSNIIFVRGEPKLADIGLVASSNASISWVGTEGFLPPEGPGRAPADIYALGKVLYEISTGRDRHDFPELPTMLREDPQRRALEEFNEIILKACDPDVRRRYATAATMRADLELLRAGKSLQNKRRRERGWVRARRIMGLTAATVLLAALASPWFRTPEGGRSLPMRLQVDGAEFWRVPAMPRQFDFSPDGERIVFSGPNLISVWERQTRITRPLALRGAGDWKIAGVRGAVGMPRWAPDSRHIVCQAVRQVGGTFEGPVLSYAFLVVDASTGDVRQLGAEMDEAGRAQDARWRPDGDAISYMTRQRLFFDLSLRGERVPWATPELGDSTRFQLGDYSPDGAWLLISAGGQLWDLHDREIWAVPHLGGSGSRLTDHAGVDSFPTWSADGQSVLFVSAGGRREAATWGIWRLEVDRRTRTPRGAPVEVLARSGSRFYHPKLVAGGSKLVYAVEEPQTDLWAAGADAMNSGTVIMRGQDPVLSPDGQWIYFVGERADQHGVFAIGRNGDMATLRKITDLTPLVSGLTRGGLSLSPDGRWIALFGFDGQRHGVFMIPSEGGEPRLVERLPEQHPALPVWSPDGKWLAYVVDKWIVRASPEGKEREELAPLDEWESWSLRWSPDGRHIAALGYEARKDFENDTNQQAWIVSVADKKLRRLTPEAERNYKEGLEWHPSGDYLTYMYYGPERFSAQLRRAYPDGRPTELLFDQTDHWDYVGVWAPDGRHFYFISTSERENTPEKSIHLYDAQTTQISHGVWSGGLAALPRWSRDGRTAVWAIGNTLRYFESVENID